MDEDPGHVLDVIRSAKSLEDAAEQLGTTPGYLQAFADRYEPGPEEVDVQEFPLAAGEAIPTQSLPAWLAPIPANWKAKRRWPAGAKSPSWFKKMARCPRQHAQRYRHKRPDPSGLDAIIGNAIHGAFQDAALIRLHKRKGAPQEARKEELLTHLERQPEVVHDRGTEVYKRAREIVEEMDSALDLGNVWAAEFVWSFHASAGLLVAGIADLILVFLDPANPHGPPELVLVVDYKTGPGQVPSKTELENDPQSCLELIWARRYFQDAKRVQFLLWNVGQNERVAIDWNYQLEASTLAFVRACWNLWCQGIEKANVAASCKYCPYRSNCKEYGKELQRQAYRSKDSLEEKGIEELAPIAYQARKIAEIAEQRRKDASELILKKLPPLKKKYATGRFLVRKKSKTLDTFSTSDTIMKLADETSSSLAVLLDSFASISPQKLKAWVQTLPEDKKERAENLIRSLKHTRTTPPWIEVREVDNAGF